MTCRSACRCMALLLLALFASVAAARLPEAARFTTADGLPSNAVHQVVQDRQRYLWFATDDGLARFDGRQFRLWRREQGLADNALLSLAVDAQDQLWMGTGYGTLMRMSADRSRIDHLGGVRDSGLADPAIRVLAAKKVERTLRIGRFFGAKYYVYWVARDGFEVPVLTQWESLYTWLADGLNRDEHADQVKAATAADAHKRAVGGRGAQVMLIMLVECIEGAVSDGVYLPRGDLLDLTLAGHAIDRFQMIFVVDVGLRTGKDDGLVEGEAHAVTLEQETPADPITVFGLHVTVAADNIR